MRFFWKNTVYRVPKYTLTRRLFKYTKWKFLQKRLERYSITERYFRALPKELTHDTQPSKKELRPQIFLSDAEIFAAKNFLAQIAAKILTANILPNVQVLANANVSPDANVSSNANILATVILHPYASHDEKKWPKNHWFTLINVLDEQKIPWLIVGQNTEPLLKDDIRDCTNKTDLRMLCALMSLAKVVVSGDSGPLHLANAVHTPIIALMGPTSKVWGFYPDEGEHIILERNLPCRPCSLHGNVVCKKNLLCLNDIAPKEVFEQIQKYTYPTR